MIRLLADIAVGIFSAILASHLFQVKLDLIMLLFGIIFAWLLPDLDFVVEWIRGRKPLGRFTRDHRNLFHLPIPYISVGSLIVIWFGWLWLFLIVVNSLWHFFHDSFGIGSGIKWLYPISKKKYKIGKSPKRPGKENWIKEIYFRLTWISISEPSMFLISLVVLFLYLKL